MRVLSSDRSHLRQAGVPDFELTICSIRCVRVSSLPVAFQCLTSLGSSSTEQLLLSPCSVGICLFQLQQYPVLWRASSSHYGYRFGGLGNTCQCPPAGNSGRQTSASSGIL